MRIERLARLNTENAGTVQRDRAPRPAGAGWGWSGAVISRHSQGQPITCPRAQAWQGGRHGPSGWADHLPGAAADGPAGCRRGAG